MRYLSGSDLEAISLRVLRAYWKLTRAQKTSYRVDQDVLAEDLLGLTIKYRHLSEDRLTLGMTAFSPLLINLPDNQEDFFELDGKTMLIESDLQNAEGNIGRRNFTVGHENSHHILKMLYPKDYAGGIRQRRVLVYRAPDIKKRGAGSPDPEERQMDMLTSYLLMPEALLRKNMRIVGIPDGIPILNQMFRSKEYEAFLLLCEMMGVSKQALKLRLIRLGLLGKDQTRHPRQMAEIWKDDNEVD